jgi:hypothetical protein
VRKKRNTISACCDQNEAASAERVCGWRAGGSERSTTTDLAAAAGGSRPSLSCLHHRARSRRLPGCVRADSAQRVTRASSAPPMRFCTQGWGLRSLGGASEIVCEILERRRGVSPRFDCERSTHGSPVLQKKITPVALLLRAIFFGISSSYSNYD